MAKSMYKNPGGESSLTGGKVPHHEPLSGDAVRHARDHVATQKRVHSDEDSYDNVKTDESNRELPGEMGEGSRADVLSGKRD